MTEEEILSAEIAEDWVEANKQRSVEPRRMSRARAHSASKRPARCSRFWSWIALP